MAYMKDSAGRRLDSFAATGPELRRRDTPGIRGLPTLMASPPTLTAGTAGGASTITSGVLARPDQPGKFTVKNTTPQMASSTSPGNSSVRATPPAAGSTTPTWAVEFDLDTTTGIFEIKNVGQGASNGVRILIWKDGGWQYATALSSFGHGADGAVYFDKVDLGAAGVYRIRLEFGYFFWFMGIQMGPIDSVTAAGHNSRKIVIVGDSYTEPVIIDTNGSFSWDGYCQLLNYMLGCEVIPSAIGGTGYLATNGGTKPKFRDRLADVYAVNPDEVWWFAGYNDRFTAAATVATEAQLCYQAVKDNLPNAKQVIWSPQWPSSHQTMSSGLIELDDALKAVAATMGILYLDLSRQTPGLSSFANTTVSTSASAGASSISVAGPIPNLAYLQLGVGGTREIRRAGAVSGTGPYSVPLDAVLTYAHPAGEAVTPTGPNIVTGTGRQGSTNATGSADRFTGNDNTHPTKPGHRNFAVNMYHMYAQTLAP